jgi:dehydrogenase/reductase SDR family protein 13
VEGRTFLVTGANSGIGRALVEALAARRATVVLAARSEARTMPVLQRLHARFPGVDATFLPIDLAHLASVRQAAESFLATRRPLHVLVNNAGVAGTNALSRDGFDLTYATNHIGPFLLTRLLLPRLSEASDARIVNVASAAHMQVKHLDLAVLSRRASASRSGFAAYAATKLMNILHAKELARRMASRSVASYALHPGTVASDIWRALPRPLQLLLKLFMLTNEQGARTPFYCATAPELRGVSGRYYDACREKRPNRLAESEELAQELWDRTEAVISQAAGGNGP